MMLATRCNLLAGQPKATAGTAGSGGPTRPGEPATNASTCTEGDYARTAVAWAAWERGREKLSRDGEAVVLDISAPAFPAASPAVLIDMTIR